MSHLNLTSIWMSSSLLPTWPSGNEADMENGNLEGEKARAIRTSKAIKIPNQALLSGMAYCISSCSMILINKFVLSSYDFNAGISLMLYQVIHPPPLLLCLSFCKWISELQAFYFKICGILFLPFVAELYFSAYCIYTVCHGCDIYGAIDMEIAQSLATCQYYICWNAHYKHVQVSILVLFLVLLCWLL